MFRIRKEQMDALRRADLARFVRRAIKHIRAEAPGSLPGEADAAEAFVRDGIARAAAHGFEEEIDVLHYLELMALIGPDFAERPEAEFVMGLLYDEEAREDWPTAREMFLAAREGV